MKVLVFVREFAAPTLTFIYNEIKAISTRHEVLVLTTERTNEDRFPFPNVRVVALHRHPFMAKQIRRFQDDNWGSAFKNSHIRRVIQEVVDHFRPDLIHVHFGGQGWIFLSNWPIGRIPIFLSFHGYDASMKLRSKRYRNQCRSILDRPDVIPIFVSLNMAARMEAAIGPIPDHQILYYGTDLEFFKQTGSVQRRPHETHFLQVSSFTAKKGHSYTIRAFAQYVSKLPEGYTARLTLAGEGPLLSESRALVSKLGLDEVVQFPGLVTPLKSRELMESAHVFVHHSVTPQDTGDQEGIPNAIMEAMAMELPVVSTVHSGIPELVEHGVNGFLVPERDVEAYADALQAISEWNLMPQNRDKVLRLFSREGHLEKLDEMYNNQIKRFSHS
ncbi:MAG: glycosyltransferase [Saprospiraceae bacterium]|nr:glycosyltransferase [Saprospiraceae bacterium]